jgi:hypothetical protein
MTEPPSDPPIPLSSGLYLAALPLAKTARSCAFLRALGASSRRVARTSRSALRAQTGCDVT